MFKIARTRDYLDKLYQRNLLTKMVSAICVHIYILDMLCSTRLRSFMLFTVYLLIVIIFFCLYIIYYDFIYSKIYQICMFVAGAYKVMCKQFFFSLSFRYHRERGHHILWSLMCSCSCSFIYPSHANTYDKSEKVWKWK